MAEDVQEGESLLIYEGDEGEDEANTDIENGIDTKVDAEKLKTTTSEKSHTPNNSAPEQAESSECMTTTTATTGVDENAVER